MGYFERFEPRVYYRIRTGGPLIEEKFENRGFIRDSENKTFQWKPTERDDLLRGTLKLRMQTAVCLERFELRLSAKDLHKPSVSLHDDISPDSSLRLFQHGYHSWSWTGARESDETDDFCLLKWKHDLDENPETPFSSRIPVPLPVNVLPRKGIFHSEFLVMLETHARALKRKNGKCIVFTTFGQGDQFVKFRVHLAPRTGRLREFAIVWDGAGLHLAASAIITLTAVKHFNSVQIRPRTRVRIKRIQPAPAEFLDACVAQSARSFHPLAHGQPVTGWCSWYHYYNKISEGMLLRNLRMIQERKIEIDFFQIDDGWQKNIGDWTETSETFTSGMRFFADAILETGLKPGIWLAPFVARPGSRTFEESKELVLRDEEGDPVLALYNPLWGGNTYALDVTHPHFKKWLEHAINTIVHVWGYTYLKLDFLYAACYRGAHHDPRKGPAVRLRETLELIRRIAGKKTFLLGCGCPIMPSIGSVNAMRVGPDVNSRWGNDWLGTILRDRNYPSAEACLRSAINRSFMHRRFFMNDPDCLLVRDNSTHLSIDQVKLMASIMALTGGMILLSDDVESLSEDRLALFRLALRMHQKCARHTALPLGLMDEHFPRGLYNEGGFLGVWNPTSTPDRVHLLIPARLAGRLRNAKNIWDGHRIPWTVGEDWVEISLAPYECVVTET